MIGHDSNAEVFSATTEKSPASSKSVAIGKPLLVGLTTLATAAGILSYLLINLAWRWRVVRQRQKNQQDKEFS